MNPKYLPESCSVDDRIYSKFGDLSIFHEEKKECTKYNLIKI